jgi:hypothetical protein
MVKKRDDHGGARKAAPNRRPLAGQSLLQIHLLSTRYSRRAASCTRIPLSTPLARLVTPDLAVGVIERDHSAGRERACDPIEGWSAAACEAGVPGFDVRSMPNRLQALTVAVSRIDGAGMLKSEKESMGT